MAEEEEEKNYREQNYREAYQKAMEKRKIELMIKSKLREVLEPDAYERLMRVKIANEELFHKSMLIILQLSESKRLAGRLNDEQVKSLLSQVTGGKREPTIEFKRK